MCDLTNSLFEASAGRFVWQSDGAKGFFQSGDLQALDHSGRLQHYLPNKRLVDAVDNAVFTRIQAHDSKYCTRTDL